MSPHEAEGFLAPHEDERRARDLAGLAPARAAIRPAMPEQHRQFFGLLTYLFTATLDAGGWPIASVLWRDRPFIGSPDPATLRITAMPAADDPANPGFVAGNPIGLLGLDFTTRRRNRANGRLVAADGALVVQVAQSFGNCAQYVQTRTPTPRPPVGTTLETLGALDAAAARLIAASDTFVVASRARDGLAGGGLDASHRGGRPGFVRVDGATLTVPDFRGNRYFNTLGNLLGDPRAGLLFVDFSTGDLLQLQGRVAIDWHAERAPRGAERLWRLQVERAWRRRGALPFSWSFGEFAPTTLATEPW